MTPKQKKLFIILIPIIIVIITIVVLVLLYLTTDFLKSNQTLFFKYASQNVEAAAKIMDNTSEQEYTKMLHQNKYEINSELTAQYIKNANTSQEDKSSNINKLKLQIDGQSDYQSGYDYRNVKIAYDNETLFGAECIHSGSTYGVKFTDIFNQYLSIENNNLKELAEKCGIEQEQIDKIPNTIEGIDLNALLSLTPEQTSQLQNTYLNILLNNIPAESYSKQKNALITVNNNSITTNAYILKLTQEQVNNVYIKILEQLKTDEVILSKITEVCEILSISDIDTIKENYAEGIEEEITQIKDNNIGTEQITYTVYQANGQVIRTTVETAETTIVIDLNKTDTSTEVNIEIANENDIEENKNAIKITKSNTASEDEFSVEIQATLGEVISTGKMYRTKTIEGSTINVETGYTYDDGNYNTTSIQYNENINIVQQIETITLEEKENNVTLNNYSAEQIAEILNMVNEQLTQKLLENQELINGIIPNELNPDNQEPVIEIQENGQLSEVEKNRFNSKFEFYTGEEVSSEDIEKLLDVVKDNLATAQVSYSEDETSTSTSSNKKLQSIRLSIEKDKQNKELADTVMELIETNKKYTVTIQYDETTDMVSYITLTVNK